MLSLFFVCSWTLTDWYSDSWMDRCTSRLVDGPRTVWVTDQQTNWLTGSLTWKWHCFDLVSFSWYVHVCIQFAAHGVTFLFSRFKLVFMSCPPQPWHDAFGAAIDSDVGGKPGDFAQTYAAFLLCAWHQPANHLWRLWQTSHGHGDREPGTAKIPDSYTAGEAKERKYFSA